MPSRLVILAFACAALLGLFAGTANADPTKPVRGLQLESPAKFTLPKLEKKPKHLRVSLSQRAVSIARTQLGVPYVWGGASPSGFDCSGLVMWVYGRLGISLPHNAAALYGVGRPVPRSRLRPGDLLFFSGLGHVGLYIGRGRMIHAPQSGRSVEIARLASRSAPIGARRVTRF
jgi:cell wall-associated NlpC family hydrolase